jgi:hypothetical protein
MFKKKALVNGKRIPIHKYKAVAGNGFRSGLEAYCSKLLQDQNIPFDYEKHVVMLHPRFQFCSFDAKKGIIKQTCSCRDMTYTPDFVSPDWSWVIETKGMATPEFMLKWKLFKYWLKQHHPQCLAYVSHSQKDTLLTVEDIKKRLKLS